jgi:hypothetical protein
MIAALKRNCTHAWHWRFANARSEPREVLAV